MSYQRRDNAGYGNNGQNNTWQRPQPGRNSRGHPRNNNNAREYGRNRSYAPAPNRYSWTTTNPRYNDYDTHQQISSYNNSYSVPNFTNNEYVNDPRMVNQMRMPSNTNVTDRPNRQSKQRNNVTQECKTRRVTVPGSRITMEATFHCDNTTLPKDITRTKLQNLVNAKSSKYEDSIQDLVKVSRDNQQKALRDMFQPKGEMVKPVADLTIDANALPTTFLNAIEADIFDNRLNECPKNIPACDSWENAPTPPTNDYDDEYAHLNVSPTLDFGPTISPSPKKVLIDPESLTLTSPWPSTNSSIPESPLLELERNKSPYQSSNIFHPSNATSEETKVNAPEAHVQPDLTWHLRSEPNDSRHTTDPLRSVTVSLPQLDLKRYQSNSSVTEKIPTPTEKIPLPTTCDTTNASAADAPNNKLPRATAPRVQDDFYTRSKSTGQKLKDFTRYNIMNSNTRLLPPKTRATEHVPLQKRDQLKQKQQQQQRSALINHDKLLELERQQTQSHVVNTINTVAIDSNQPTVDKPLTNAINSSDVQMRNGNVTLPIKRPPTRQPKRDKSDNNTVLKSILKSVEHAKKPTDKVTNEKPKVTSPNVKQSPKITTNTLNKSQIVSNTASKPASLFSIKLNVTNLNTEFEGALNQANSVSVSKKVKAKPTIKASLSSSHSKDASTIEVLKTPHMTTKDVTVETEAHKASQATQTINKKVEKSKIEVMKTPRITTKDVSVATEPHKATQATQTVPPIISQQDQLIQVDLTPKTSNKRLQTDAPRRKHTKNSETQTKLCKSVRLSTNIFGIPQLREAFAQTEPQPKNVCAHAQTDLLGIVKLCDKSTETSIVTWCDKSTETEPAPNSTSIETETDEQKPAEILSHDMLEQFKAHANISTENNNKYNNIDEFIKEMYALVTRHESELCAERNRTPRALTTELLKVCFERQSNSPESVKRPIECVEMLAINQNTCQIVRVDPKNVQIFDEYDDGNEDDKVVTDYANEVIIEADLSCVDENESRDVYDDFDRFTDVLKNTTKSAKTHITPKIIDNGVVDTSTDPKMPLISTTCDEELPLQSTESSYVPVASICDTDELAHSIFTINHTPIDEVHSSSEYLNIRSSFGRKIRVKSTLKKVLETRYKNAKVPADESRDAEPPIVRDGAHSIRSPVVDNSATSAPKPKKSRSNSCTRRCGPRDYKTFYTPSRMLILRNRPKISKKFAPNKLPRVMFQRIKVGGRNTAITYRRKKVKGARPKQNIGDFGALTHTNKVKSNKKGQSEKAHKVPRNVIHHVTADSPLPGFQHSNLSNAHEMTNGVEKVLKEPKKKSKCSENLSNIVAESMPSHDKRTEHVTDCVTTLDAANKAPAQQNCAISNETAEKSHENGAVDLVAPQVPLTTETSKKKRKPKKKLKSSDVITTKNVLSTPKNDVTTSEVERSLNSAPSVTPILTKTTKGAKKRVRITPEASLSSDVITTKNVLSTPKNHVTTSEGEVEMSLNSTPSVVTPILTKATKGSKKRVQFTPEASLSSDVITTKNVLSTPKNHVTTSEGEVEMSLNSTPSVVTPILIKTTKGAKKRVQFTPEASLSSDVITTKSSLSTPKNHVTTSEAEMSLNSTLSVTPILTKTTKGTKKRVQFTPKASSKKPMDTSNVITNTTNNDSLMPNNHVTTTEFANKSAETSETFNFSPAQAQIMSNIIMPVQHFPKFALKRKRKDVKTPDNPKRAKTTNKFERLVEHLHLTLHEQKHLQSVRVSLPKITSDELIQKHENRSSSLATHTSHTPHQYVQNMSDDGLKVKICASSPTKSAKKDKKTSTKNSKNSYKKNCSESKAIDNDSETVVSRESEATESPATETHTSDEDVTLASLVRSLGPVASSTPDAGNNSNQMTRNVTTNALNTSRKSVIKLGVEPKEIVLKNYFRPTPSYCSAGIRIGPSDDMLVCATVMTCGTLLAGSSSGKIYKILRGGFYMSAPVVNSRVNGIGFVTGEEVTVYATALDGSLLFLEPDKMICISKYKYPAGIQCVHTNWNTIFMGSVNGHLFKYDLLTNLATKETKLAESAFVAINSADLNGEQVLLLVARGSGVDIVNAHTHQMLHKLTNDQLPSVYSVVVDRGTNVFLGNSGNQVKRYDLVTGKLLQEYNCAKSACIVVKGNVLYAGCYDGFVYIFNVATGELIASVNTTNRIIMALEVTKSQLYVVSLRNTLKLFDIPMEVQAVANL